jgi:hypothetical protein
MIDTYSKFNAPLRPARVIKVPHERFGSGSEGLVLKSLKSGIVWFTNNI